MVEDDAVYGAALVRALTREGFEVRLAPDVASALAAQGERPEVAVVDLKLPDGSGIDVVRALSADGCRAVMLSGHGSIRAAVEGMRAGAVDFLTKPVSTAELVQALRAAGRPPEPEPPESAARKLDEVEREHILRVLEECGGNISEAARRLGLYRRTLQRKLQKL